VDTEVKVYRRYGDEWDETGTEGGSDWPESRLVPLGVEPRHCLFSHLHGEGYHDSAIVTVDGIVGTDAVTVQALDRHGSVRHPVDSPVGAVLALVEPRSEATVTVFDGAGRILGGVIVDWEHSMTPMPAER